MAKETGSKPKREKPESQDHLNRKAEEQQHAGGNRELKDDKSIGSTADHGQHGSGVERNRGGNSGGGSRR